MKESKIKSNVPTGHKGSKSCTNRCPKYKKKETNMKTMACPTKWRKNSWHRCTVIWRNYVTVTLCIECVRLLRGVAPQLIEHVERAVSVHTVCGAASGVNEPLSY